MNDEARALIHAYLDGDLTDRQRRELSDWLRQSPHNVDRFVAECRLHSELCDAYCGRWPTVESANQPGAVREPSSSGNSSNSVPVLPVIIQDSPGLHASLFTLPLGGGFLFSYAAAVVIVGIGLLIGWACRVSIPQPGRQESAQVAPRPTPTSLRPEPEMVFVGRITGMVDCRWADPATEPFNGARVPLGRKYAMAAGLMEISYDTGAKVILEGPCTYEVESTSSGYLSLGRLTAKVEKRGEGRGEREENLANRQFVNGNPRHPSPLSPLLSPFFSVHTPTALVSDLGTEFGVECNKEGHTVSHVFRGAIRVQTLAADGKPEGVGMILRENQSARVDGRGASRVAILPPSAKLVNFVRKLSERTMRVFDLVDAVAGGNGFSGRRGRGIAPVNGQIVDVPSNKANASDGRYHRALGLPFVDGVFIPKGQNAVVQLDSAGHRFAEFNNSEDIAGGVLWADEKVKISPPLSPPNDNILYIPTVLGGVDYSRPPHGVLFVHANTGVTFDLEAIRQANPGSKLLRFRAMTANTEVHSRLLGDSNSADLWVFLDGRECFKRKNINGYSGAAPVAVPIGERSRYLTLVGTDGGDGIAADWIVFGDPRLEMMCDSQTSPDLVPNTSQPMSPRGEEVHRK